MKGGKSRRASEDGSGTAAAAAAGKPTASSIYATRQNIPVPPQKPDEARIHKSRLPRDGRGVDGCIGERSVLPAAGPELRRSQVYS